MRAAKSDGTLHSFGTGHALRRLPAAELEEVVASRPDKEYYAVWRFPFGRYRKKTVAEVLALSP